MKKISIVVVLTLSLLWLSGAQAQISSVPDAINKAGRQRMLTQRILRDYIQLGMEVRPDIAAKELPEAMSLFDSTLVDLKRFASDKAVASALADVERLWKPVKAVATTTPDRDKAEQLWLDTENLLIACNTLVQRGDYRRRKVLKQFRADALAGRVRMLNDLDATLLIDHEKHTGLTVEGLKIFVYRSGLIVD